MVCVCQHRLLVLLCLLSVLCRSPVGRFKLPQAPGKPQAQLRYAIFSCSNWVSQAVGSRLRVI